MASEHINSEQADDLKAQSAKVLSDYFKPAYENLLAWLETEIKNAEATCHRLAMKCKIMGLIPKTERELLNERINAAFPKAKSKQIVEFEGAKYKNTYSPRELSNSRKTVKSWDQEWVKQ